MSTAVSNSPIDVFAAKEIRLTLSEGQNFKQCWTRFSQVCRKHGGRYSGPCDPNDMCNVYIRPGFVWLVGDHELVQRAVEELNG